MDMASKGMRAYVCVCVCVCVCGCGCGCGCGCVCAWLIQQVLLHHSSIMNIFHDPSVFTLCPSHQGSAHISYITVVMELMNSANIMHATKNNYKSSKCSRSCSCFACINVVFAWHYSCSYRVTCAYASLFRQFFFCNTSYDDSDATKRLYIEYMLLSSSIHFVRLTPSIKFKLTLLPWTISFSPIYSLILYIYIYIYIDI
jgi:hypothetical protein